MIRALESSQFWGFRDYLQIISAKEKEQNIYEADGHFAIADIHEAPRFYS